MARAPRCAPRGAYDQPQRRWPHEVELLLDRERPVVLDWRHQNWRLREQLRVARRPSNPGPVVEVCERTEQLPPHIRNETEFAQPAERDDPQQAQQARRQQAFEPTAIKPAQRHPAVLFHLREQQRRDQESRQREEHRNAQVAAAHPAEPGVENQHHCDGDSPHSVQRRLVSQTCWRCARHARGS